MKSVRTAHAMRFIIGTQWAHTWKNGAHRAHFNELSGFNLELEAWLHFATKHWMTRGRLPVG